MRILNLKILKIYDFVIQNGSKTLNIDMIDKYFPGCGNMEWQYWYDKVYIRVGLFHTLWSFIV